MRVTIGGRRVTLADQDLLGVGGEARVYRHGDLAVKIFHPIPRGLHPAERDRLTRLHQRKADKLRAFPQDLPAQVVAPRALVEERRRGVIGYTMAAVDGEIRYGRPGIGRTREVASLTPGAFASTIAASFGATGRSSVRTSGPSGTSGTRTAGGTTSAPG